MAFGIEQKTLETLEWPPVVAHLREQCRAPQARRFSSAHRGTELQSDDSTYSDTASRPILALRDGQGPG
jgi:hypothetical protein